MPLAFGMVEILPPPIHQEYCNILFLIGIKCSSFLLRNSIQAKKIVGFYICGNSVQAFYIRRKSIQAKKLWHYKPV